MKKQYINPSMDVINIGMSPLLAGSDPKLGGEYGGGAVLSRENDFDPYWDDEE